MAMLTFEKNRELDVICLGRAGVDLYAQQSHTSLGEVSGFDKYVGGSPANIATAVAKLGGKAGFIGCVSADGLGDYVCDYLRQQGVNLDGMQVDSSGTRTSLAITQMQPEQPEVVLYRNSAADLALRVQQIDTHYIAKAKMLLISGTALCASPSREATLLAMKRARSVNTLVVLDMDYRAYSWPDVETASLYYQLAVALCDVVIGNTEEFDILEVIDLDTVGTDEKRAKALLKQGCSLVIIKAGEDGSNVYPAIGEAFAGPVFNVQALKPFGAGDAFAGTLLYALTHAYSLEDAVAMGAASAAINVAGTSCTQALPNLGQLIEFMAQHNYKITTGD